MGKKVLLLNPALSMDQAVRLAKILDKRRAGGTKVAQPGRNKITGAKGQTLKVVKEFCRQLGITVTTIEES